MAGVNSYAKSHSNRAWQRCAYTHFLDHDGYLIDDMIFAVVSENEILRVPNASMIPVMWEWFTSLLQKTAQSLLEICPQKQV